MCEGGVTSPGAAWLEPGTGLTSLSLSLRTRSAISTSDLSLVQASRSCKEAQSPGDPSFSLSLCVSPCWPALALHPPVKTHGFGQDLQVETLQLLRHLSVPMSVPAVKVWRPEELPGDRSTAVKGRGGGGAHRKYDWERMCL